MSLPSEYIEEINQLNEKITSSQPGDILQFCANYFNNRLETERSAQISKKTAMSNPFASYYSGETTFPGTLSGSGLGLGGMQPFDGTRDAIREEDEDIHSPTTPSFRPQYNVQRTSSGRRSQSPSSGGSGGSSHFSSRNQGTSGSPFLSSSSSHLSPNTAQGEFPSNYNMNRRTSVSAESLVPTTSQDEWTPPVHPKTAEQNARLRSAVANNFLFTHLDEEQFSQVLLALVEKPIPGKDTRVITQGDVGDYFYVVEKGEFDIYVNPIGRMMPGMDGMGKKVASIGPGGSFGELALMYNAPRAATVTSTTTQNVLWALDRVTFRRILMEDTFKRRRMYEAFLEEVPILSSLVTYERSKIADALNTATYEPGTTIIQEGDPGDRFYFIEQGTADVTKSGQGCVRTLSKGDYFGELALLNDAPRAASIVAKSKVKVAFLGKDGFQRLLGPAVEIMRRNDPRLTQDVDPLDPLSGVSKDPPDGSADSTQDSADRNRPVQA
ncbi:cyclic nucleotide-binding-like protein [Geopyxis carbonaria]|nr:cyclic nucleotide-binding-like protein [Geopyxis carbonaria]